MRATINLYNSDCLPAMKKMADNQYSLAIVDPPYGIGQFLHASKGYNPKKIKWNNKIPNKEYFDELKRVSVNQIIWGWNYYTEYLGSTNNILVWNKHLNYKTGFSELEIASVSWKISARVIDIPLASKLKDNINYHPCSKPVALYKWTLKNYAKEGDKILDTHFGSGSIAIACHDYGFDLDGYEIDKDYYDSALKRFNNHKSQLQLYEPQSFKS